MKRWYAFRRLLQPGGLTLLLFLARLAAAPALSDPVSGTISPALHLATPQLYLIFAPLFSLWDGVSMLSLGRLRGLLAGLALLFVLWRIFGALGRRRRFSLPREVLSLAVSLALLLGFILAGALWHRPMLSLAGVQPGELVVDFHSHTNASHDVRNTWLSGFDTEANRRWHGRAGFDVVFITDHNVMSQGHIMESHRSGGSRESPIVCPGIEVSAWRSHIVLLGDSVPVDRSKYNNSFPALLSLLQVSDSAYGALSLASLPEYRRNLWGQLNTLAATGLDGFEIVNASPKANELSSADRDSVVRLARARNRFVAGVSDSHGWGATSMVWNLVRVDSSQRGPGSCEAVLHRLRQGFGTVQIIERHRLRPDDWWPMWLTPLGVVWESWRSMNWALSVSWVAWIWGLTLLLERMRSRREAAQNSLANGTFEGQDRL